MTNNKVIMLALIPLLASCASDRELARKERIEDAKVRIMTEWDLNLDGTVTCDDMELKKIDKFTKSDLDENSILDASEFRDAPWGSKAFSVEMLYSFDENRDGQVTQQEFSDKPDAFFTALDKNDDCKVSEDEIEQSLTERRATRPSGGGGRGSGRGGGKGGRGGGRPN